MWNQHFTPCFFWTSKQVLESHDRLHRPRGVQYLVVKSPPCDSNLPIQPWTFKGWVFSQTSSFSRSGYETKQDQASHMVRKVQLYDIIKHTYGMICVDEQKSIKIHGILYSYWMFPFFIWKDLVRLNLSGQVECSKWDEKWFRICPAACDHGWSPGWQPHKKINSANASILKIWTSWRSKGQSKPNTIK